jgi:hypothetical protein
MLDGAQREELIDLIERYQITVLHTALDRAWYLGYKAAKQEVAMTDDRFTEEALKAQDGKKILFTRELGGPIIGEATLRYDSDAGALIADMRIKDTKAAESLNENVSAIIFKKES